MISSLRKSTLLVFSLVCAATAQAAESEEKTLRLDTGFVFARGSYGLATDTDVFLGLVNPTYETTNWRIEGSLPFIRLEGPATAVGNTGTSTQTHSASGVGDATLALTRKFAASKDGWSSGVGAKVKFPTADESKGLGTGKMDTTMQADVFKAGDPVSTFASAGYQFLGHSEAYPMKSGAFATVGIASKISSSMIGLAGNWRQRAIEGGDQAVELMAFVQHPLNANSKLQFFALHGFTDASPEFAVGLTLSLNL